MLKDRLVSNARLFRVALESGLDQFVVTQELTLKGWEPPYISDLLADQPLQDTKRIMSTKTLADVVEAIIGLSYTEGGITKALQCISLFLGESQTKSFAVVQDVLFSAAEPKGAALPTDFELLEDLVGYVFREKALLVEAMTHPSYNVGGTVAGYDRLEFIGDAILDFIIVEELYAVVDEHSQPLENWQMHLLRTALVNADILAFLVMEWTCSQLRFNVQVTSASDKAQFLPKEEDKANRTTDSPELAPTEISLPLWSFMRQSSPELVLEREGSKTRHAELRACIREAMETGTHYPWALFARLHAQKFHSDLYEALLGAIWVDSGPDFAKCRDFIEKSGLLAYLRRLLRDKVHVLHPKEELGRLAGSEKVDYIVTEVESESRESREWACEVKIGQRSVVSVDRCLYKEEAKVAAATRACAILKGGCM